MLATGPPPAVSATSDSGSAETRGTSVASAAVATTGGVEMRLPFAPVAPVAAVPPLADFTQPADSRHAGRAAVAAAGKLNAFEIVCLVGKGGFGKVMLVRLKGAGGADGELYAMKVMKKDILASRNALRDAQAERDILALLGCREEECPFIVRLHAAFQSPTRLYLVMDFAAGGEIMWHLRQQAMLSEEHARFYAAELLVALEFLHDRRILHRDIKPENVLLGQDGHLLLTDFGLAKDLSGFDDPDVAQKHSWCGSEDYMAPEIIAREHHTGKPADWWAFGIFVYDCLVGHPPFSPLHEYSAKAVETKTRKRLHDRILKAKFKLPPYLTSSCHKLIRALLTRDPQKRLTDPAAIRNHPWFKTIDWDLVRSKQMTPPIIPAAGSSPTACFSPSLTQMDHSAPHSPLVLSSPAMHPTVTASVPVPKCSAGASPSASSTLPADGVGIWEGFSFVAPGMEVHFELAGSRTGDNAGAVSSGAAGAAFDGNSSGPGGVLSLDCLSLGGQSQGHGQGQAQWSPPLGSSPMAPSFAALPPFALSPNGAAAAAAAAIGSVSPAGPPTDAFGVPGGGAAACGNFALGGGGFTTSSPVFRTPCGSPTSSFAVAPATELQLAAEVAEFSLDAEAAVRVDESGTSA